MWYQYPRYTVEPHHGCDPTRASHKGASLNLTEYYTHLLVQRKQVQLGVVELNIGEATPVNSLAAFTLQKVAEVIKKSAFVALLQGWPR